MTCSRRPRRQPEYGSSMTAEEDANLLSWAEEKLKGIYGPCTRCGATGRLPCYEPDGQREKCPHCDGKGHGSRIEYLAAWRRLTTEQRVQVGQERGPNDH